MFVSIRLMSLLQHFGWLSIANSIGERPQQQQKKQTNENKHQMFLPMVFVEGFFSTRKPTNNRNYKCDLYIAFFKGVYSCKSKTFFLPFALNYFNGKLNAESFCWKFRSMFKFNIYLNGKRMIKTELHLDIEIYALQPQPHTVYAVLCVCQLQKQCGVRFITTVRYNDLKQSLLFFQDHKTRNMAHKSPKSRQFCSFFPPYSFCICSVSSVLFKKSTTTKKQINCTIHT